MCVYMHTHTKGTKLVAFALCNQLIQLLTAVYDLKLGSAQCVLSLECCKVGSGVGGCCPEKPDVKPLVLGVLAILPPICNLNCKYSRLTSE